MAGSSRSPTTRGWSKMQKERSKIGVAKASALHLNRMIPRLGRIGIGRRRTLSCQGLLEKVGQTVGTPASLGVGEAAGAAAPFAAFGRRQRQATLRDETAGTAALLQLGRQAVETAAFLQLE